MNSRLLPLATLPLVLLLGLGAKRAAPGVPASVPIPVVSEPDWVAMIPPSGSAARLGYFLSPGADPLKESSYGPTTCSDLITRGTPEPETVNWEQIVQASSETTGRFGAPPFIGVKGSNVANTLMRITYTTSEVVDAVIADKAGFEACCKRAPDQCPGPYISRYYKGTGGFWVLVGTEREVSAGASVPVPQAGTIVTARVEHKGGWAWKNALDFTAGPVNFAFARTPKPGGMEVPPDWKTMNLNLNSQGYWARGESSGLPTRAEAIAVAENEAFKKLVKSVCGLDIRTGDTETMTSSGSSTGPSTEVWRTSESTFDARGFLRAVQFLAEDAEGPIGNPNAYQGKALGFIANSEVEGARASGCPTRATTAPPAEGSESTDGKGSHSGGER